MKAETERQVRALADIESDEKPQQSAGLSEYACLKEQLERAGLLRKREGWYLGLMLLLGSGLGVGTLFLLLAESFPLRLLAALGLSILSTHVGFLGHDAIHQQVFRRPRHNKLLGLVCKNLLLGASAGWWHDNHSRHHTDANIIGRDPDSDVPVFAYSDAQAQQRHGLLRPVVGLQAYLIFLSSVSKRSPRGSRRLASSGGKAAAIATWR